MADLSKVTHLELRQKIQPMAERLAAIENHISKLLDEQRELGSQIRTILEEGGWDTSFHGDICAVTQLPIFADDSYQTILTLT